MPVALSGLRYRGWLPNHRVPGLFARHRLTVHVPRRPYAQKLPGIPTIRPFEAMACGIPLICAPWAMDVAVAERFGFEDVLPLWPYSAKRAMFVFSVAGKLAVDGTGDGV